MHSGEKENLLEQGRRGGAKIVNRRYISIGILQHVKQISKSTNDTLVNHYGVYACIEGGAVEMFNKASLLMHITHQCQE